MSTHYLATAAHGTIQTNTLGGWREVRKLLAQMRREGHTILVTHANGRQHLLRADRPVAYCVGGFGAYVRWVRRGALAPCDRFFREWHKRTGSKLPASVREQPQSAQTGLAARVADFASKVRT